MTIDVWEGERKKTKGGLTFHVPGDVAVEGPDARVVGDEADDDVALARHGHRVPLHGVLQVPRRVAAVAELAGAPAYDLEAVS